MNLRFTPVKVGQGNTCLYTSLLGIILLFFSYKLASPHYTLQDGQGLTESVLCSSLLFTSRSSVLVATGIPTDVNWAVWRRPVVAWLSSRESNAAWRSYKPTRELSDDMSALLYNLDNTITLQAKPGQRARNLSSDAQNTARRTWRYEKNCDQSVHRWRHR